MKIVSACIAAVLTLSACQSAERPASVSLTGTGDSAAHAEWSRTAVIYEVNVRQFTPEGTFTALQAHLPRLRDLGVNILWLMPVQPIGEKERKGPLGSYYSIRDYRAINPEFGTEADLRAFIAAAHQHGLKVILDWVANHTAFDHAWTTEHRDWYTLRPDGSISVALDKEGRESDWTDVADLNYTNGDMRRAMIGEMRWWVDSMGIDGFRCDFAGLVPDDFWAEARRELLQSRPDLFMLAEWEDPRMHQWFDMTYGWELHHMLNRIAQGKHTTDSLDAYFAKQDSAYPRGAYRMYFTSNHDENSWQGSEFERMGANHIPAYVLSATVQNSMPLLYTGQEASLQKRLRFFDKDTVDWNGPSLAGFYRSLFELKEQQEALWNGAAGGPQVRLQTDGGGSVYAFTRTRGASTVLVAVNFGNAPVNAAYQGLPAPGDYTDWFSDSSVSLGAAGHIAVPANGYRILVR